MARNHIITVFALFAILSGLPRELKAGTGVYRFNDLSPGFLVGQDGWLNQPHTANASVEVYDKGAGNLAVRHSGNGGQAVYRFNDANFSFPSFSAGETNAMAYADFLVRYQGGQYNALVGFAADSSDAGAVINQSTEISPYFGLVKSTSTAGVLALVLRGASDGTVNFEPVAAYANDGDWIRLKMVMNLAAGTGSLFFRNLSQRSPDYVPVPNCTGVSLQLGRMSPDCPPSSWNAMFMRMTSDLSQQTARNACTIDNVIPHVNGALPLEIAAVAPPSWMKITLDRLTVGEQYIVRSAPIEGEDWVNELVLTATRESMVLELEIDPGTFASRKFQAVLIP